MGMTERTADTPTAGQADRGQRTGADTLRYLPPAAALGTAFVLQVIAVTDTVGGVLADRFGTNYMYAVGVLLGVSVGSCFEGGAAYLMDLYDRHLLARDSVWLLRLGMALYVAASAGAIHWWLDSRGLPTLISWLLAGMSASALFLWSRGSRWRHRQAMIAAGQLDPALPRLPIAAKVLHPIRWMITLYLISWEPVATTAEARARYDTWRADHQAREAAKRTAKADSRQDKNDRHNLSTPSLTVEAAPVQVDSPADTTPDTLRSPVRLVVSAPAKRTHTPVRAEVSVEQLARTLDKRFPDEIPGKPRALAALKAVYGSCSGERAIAAKNLLSAWRSGQRQADTSDSDSDQERDSVGATA